MTELPEFDERYPTFREFSALRERVVALEMQGRAPAPIPVAHPQELQGLSLAIQRMMDALDRHALNTGSGGNGVNVVVRALAIVGAVSIGAMGMWFFLHH